LCYVVNITFRALVKIIQGYGAGAEAHLKFRTGDEATAI